MELDRETAIIEAILFLETEPASLADLVRISTLSKDVVMDAVALLEEKYTSPGHGLEIVEIGGGFLLSPKAELWDYLKERYGKKNEGRLSKAAVETLSIIAYSQPITKGEIESIRGVSAEGMLKLLLSKKLVRPVGKKEAPGRPVQYGTTKDFLKMFRLNSIADLPKLDDANRERFELNG